METFSTISAILGLILLIVFLVMTLNIGNIRKNVQSMQRILAGWAEATGYGMVYTCLKCKKKFEGKQLKCPHCGDVKDWENLITSSGKTTV